MYLTGRNRTRVLELAAELGVEGEDVDLGSLKDVARFAGRMYELEAEGIDALVNNAAVVGCPYGKTENGLESQLGTNHLGHFLLTRLLLPLVLRRNGKIVHVSSQSADSGEFVPEAWGFDVQRDRGRMQHYKDSKFLQTLFSFELAKRLDRAGSLVTCNAVHPGVLVTGAGRHILPPSLHFIIPIAQNFFGGIVMHSFEDATSTLVSLTTSPEMSHVSGSFLHRCLPMFSKTAAFFDGELTKRAWEASEAVVDPHGKLLIRGSGFGVKSPEDWYEYVAPTYDVDSWDFLSVMESETNMLDEANAKEFLPAAESPIVVEVMRDAECPPNAPAIENATQTNELVKQRVDEIRLELENEMQQKLQAQLEVAGNGCAFAEPSLVEHDAAKLAECEKTQRQIQSIKVAWELAEYTKRELEKKLHFAEANAREQSKIELEKEFQERMQIVKNEHQDLNQLRLEIKRELQVEFDEKLRVARSVEAVRKDAVEDQAAQDELEAQIELLKTMLNDMGSTDVAEKIDSLTADVNNAVAADREAKNDSLTTNMPIVAVESNVSVPIADNGTATLQAAAEPIEAAISEKLSDAATATNDKEAYDEDADDDVALATNATKQSVATAAAADKTTIIDDDDYDETADL